MHLVVRIPNVEDNHTPLLDDMEEECMHCTKTLPE